MTMRRTAFYIALAILLVSGFAGARYLESSGTARRALGPFAPQGTATDGRPPPGRERPFGGPDTTASPETSASPDRETVLAGDVLPPVQEGDVYWGMYTPGAPYEDEASVRAFERAGTTPAILMWYQEWAGEPAFPASEAEGLLQRGVVPMLTWEAWDPPAEDPDLEPTDVREESRQPRFQLERIIEGEFDGYIRDYAVSVRKYGGPVMIRLFHEMNGFWFPWAGTVNDNDPEDFVDAWRHVVDIFDEAGATNVNWVWNPNAESVPDRPENDLDEYWPGDDYVDWTGLSGFNFGTTSDVSRWRAFTETFSEPLEDLSEYDQPIVIAEFASAEEGGDKATWITGAFAAMIDTFPKVDAAVWFDREINEARDFRIDSSDGALDAFQRAVATEQILSAPAALRRTEPVPVPAPTHVPATPTPGSPGSPTP